jgi:NitT/TauT family transport system ATP-binding protein
MKMRASIARALSVAPQILLLDEPFGALDEINRNQLNEDLLTIRAHDPFTACFVTHSVAEAVFLSTRIVLLAPNPGRIAHTLQVPFAYPRTADLREDTDYLSLLAEVSHQLRSAGP